jgi:hypothetical protein
MKLAVVGSMGVQRCLAGNPNTPPEVLMKLAVVSNQDIQERVAENPNACLEYL